MGSNALTFNVKGNKLSIETQEQGSGKASSTISVQYKDAVSKIGKDHFANVVNNLTSDNVFMEIFICLLYR